VFVNLYFMTPKNFAIRESKIAKTEPKHLKQCLKHITWI